jgi:hypothetical protein
MTLDCIIHDSLVIDTIFLISYTFSLDLHSTEKSLLTEGQVLAIGSHLVTLLVETKHRGAFEQAYVGFSKLCGRLWRHPSSRLHHLPRLWLEEVMYTISWGKSTKLCATRRSAGLPFMVQVECSAV